MVAAGHYLVAREWNRVAGPLKKTFAYFYPQRDHESCHQCLYSNDVHHQTHIASQLYRSNDSNLFARVYPSL